MRKELKQQTSQLLEVKPQHDEAAVLVAVDELPRVAAHIHADLSGHRVVYLLELAEDLLALRGLAGEAELVCLDVRQALRGLDRLHGLLCDQLRGLLDVAVGDERPGHGEVRELEGLALGVSVHLLLHDGVGLTNARIVQVEVAVVLQIAAAEQVHVGPVLADLYLVPELRQLVCGLTEDYHRLDACEVEDELERLRSGFRGRCVVHERGQDVSRVALELLLLFPSGLLLFLASLTPAQYLRFRLLLHLEKELVLVALVAPELAVAVKVAALLARKWDVLGLVQLQGLHEVLHDFELDAQRGLVGASRALLHDRPGAGQQDLLGLQPLVAHVLAVRHVQFRDVLLLLVVWVALHGRVDEVDEPELLVVVQEVLLDAVLEFLLRYLELNQVFDYVWICFQLVCDVLDEALLAGLQFCAARAFACQQLETFLGHHHLLLFHLDFYLLLAGLVEQVVEGRFLADERIVFYHYLRNRASLRIRRAVDRGRGNLDLRLVQLVRVADEEDVVFLGPNRGDGRDLVNRARLGENSGLVHVDRWGVRLLVLEAEAEPLVVQPKLSQSVEVQLVLRPLLHGEVEAQVLLFDLIEQTERRAVEFERELAHRLALLRVQRREFAVLRLEVDPQVDHVQLLHGPEQCLQVRHVGLPLFLQVALQPLALHLCLALLLCHLRCHPAFGVVRRN